MVVTPFIQQLTWADVREEVKKTDRALTKIIDKISPNKNYSLFKITYSFGDLIVKDGVLQLPQEKGLLLSLRDADLDAKIQDKLGYSSIPLFLTLKNCHEVFLDTHDRIIPLNLFNPGTLLGLFESMDFLFNCKSHPRWNVSAGARSIFMLTKISEMQGLRRLCKHYELDDSHISLINLSDHWHLFKSIAAHPSFTQSWQSEILIFSKEWLTNKDPSWAEFHYYLFQYAWKQSQFAISKIELSLIWETFLKTVALRRLKPTTYLANHVKHLMLIAAGRSPGFRPSDASQQVAPCRGLQEAFLNIYMLKHYLPTFMHPQLLDAASELPVYYSLMFPTLLEGSPYKKNSSTIMLDLHNIHLLLNILLNSLSDNKFFMATGLQNILFKCFHVEDDRQGKINSSRLIPEQDPGFLQEKIQFPDRVFCASSSFWRGSIQIVNNPNLEASQAASQWEC
ncbi:MAG: hypothetical protein K0R24_1726 [Gammaproteobacteria bacterium]|jgi:hypothetical protein|nr:hypothetical protein [Gammaproteobacteria bacterium]